MNFICLVRNFTKIFPLNHQIISLNQIPFLYLFFCFVFLCRVLERRDSGHLLRNCFWCLCNYCCWYFFSFCFLFQFSVFGMQLKNRMQFYFVRVRCVIFCHFFHFLLLSVLDKFCCWKFCFIIRSCINVKRSSDTVDIIVFNPQTLSGKP